MTCDFVYTEAQGEITDFTYDTATKQVSITGTNLTLHPIRFVKFAKSVCAVDASTLTNSSLTCTLVQEPTCGDHVPYLTTRLGLINNSANLTAITVTCTVASILPTTQLNLLGNDNLTISGTYFPYNLNTSTVEIKFTDAQLT